MRTERDMFDLILSTAREDERIRAVVLNGSRANPNAPKDIFQDYDVVYVVTEARSFRENPGWIRRFGELMILQLPDEMGDKPAGMDDHFAYLMQFTDGTRIDLGIDPIAQHKELGSDSLSVLLLDKDGIIGELTPSNESDYLSKPPTARQYSECCNEFWWVSPYAAKGLWRGEILYAKYMFDQLVREQLMIMLRWYIGIKTGFKVNPGKFGKYFEKYIEPELWELLLKTYSDASYEHTWEALITGGKVFEQVAIPVAEYFQYQYPFAEAKRVSAYLEHIRRLPKDAKEIY
jgi:aminoglycoside 6-adenylyltransferase